MLKAIFTSKGNSSSNFFGLVEAVTDASLLVWGALSKSGAHLCASWALVWAELQDNSEVDLLKEQRTAYCQLLPFSTPAWPAAVWPVPPAHQWKAVSKATTDPSLSPSSISQRPAMLLTPPFCLKHSFQGFWSFLGPLLVWWSLSHFYFLPMALAHIQQDVLGSLLSHLHLQTHLLLGSSCFKSTVLSSVLSSNQLHWSVAPHCEPGIPNPTQHLAALQSWSSPTSPGFIYAAGVLPGNWGTLCPPLSPPTN